MDLTQAIILSAIVILTIFLVFVGFQAFFTLKDLRKTLKKVNQFVDDANLIAQEVKRPLESASNLFTALTTGAGIIHLLKRSNKKEQQDE